MLTLYIISLNYISKTNYLVRSLGLKEDSCIHTSASVSIQAAHSHKKESENDK